MRRNSFDMLTLILCLMLPGAADAFAHGKEKHKRGGPKILPVASVNAASSSAEAATAEHSTGGDIANSPIRQAIELIAHNYLVGIKPIFKQACFDCHTSLTEYPWYYSMPGVKGLIDSDIADGREHLDFSNDYPFLSHGHLADDLRAIGRVLKENTMPPIEYTVMHWSRSLRPEQKTKVLTWVEDSLSLLRNAGYVAAAAD